MNDQAKTIKLNYPSEDRFLRDYQSLKKGRLGIPTPSPLPVGARVRLVLGLPGRSEPLILEGAVKAVLDKEAAAAKNQKPGMMIALDQESVQKALALESEPGEQNSRAPDQPEKPAPPPPPPRLTDQPKPRPAPVKPPPSPPPPPLGPADQQKPNSASSVEPRSAPVPPVPPPESPPAPEAASSPPPPPPMASIEFNPKDRSDPEPSAEPLPSPAPLDLEWLREVMSQAEVSIEEEEEAAPPPPPVEKKELTPAERERVKPSAEFIMNLAKAMLRSGYYSPDHPESKTVKTGLYEELLKALGDSPEIMLANQETRERTDILITGILEEPVSVRMVVGAGMAELFVPRLRDYYNRKGLISFAVKREISPDHFEAFVDIMSDPKVDRGENAQAGALLTRSLVERGITEISTVFMDDMIVLEQKLPWRVEMAIQRLAKDLKVLPMFKDKTAEQIKTLKAQIVQDIIRPLRHPSFLKDIIINSHIIARHVKGLDLEDLPGIIVNCFPLSMLMPTSRFIFQDMKRLMQAAEENPDNPAAQHRLAQVKETLKLVAKRVVLEDAPGARGFLEEMYFNEILSLAELPSEVQYRVNSLLLADSIKDDPGSYGQGLLAARTAEDAMVVLKSLKRAAPLLIEQGAFSALLAVSKDADRASREARAFLGGSDLPMRPLLYIFDELLEDLGAAYMNCEKSDRDQLDKLLPLLGPPAVGILVRVLGEAQDRGVRKSAVEGLAGMGDLALKWVQKHLDDASQPWFLHRNLLLLLGRIGGKEQDAPRIRKFLSHPRPRIREEALGALVRLQGKAAEQTVIESLEDKDHRVQQRAASFLNMLHPLSEAAMKSLLQKFEAEIPKEKEDAEAQTKKLTILVNALANLANLENPVALEQALIGLLRKREGGKKKGLLKRIKHIFEDELDPELFAAVINALGKLGGEDSAAFLEELAAQESELGRKAKEALDRIKLRSPA